ncbi:MAG: SAM-dependent chlorinase/fluorinase [Bacteroidetes bacterium]|nr:SAM-dependent chlorinase/fluorinase [Bacteroidota bacterium]MBK9673183.1 SAM-dependent chlorinase/fluorinase [Bacteroidota bacterium]MBP6413749.1 SAM-dependent chlorinase/fluorinase [Bacteroidia bacterium]
MKSTNLVNSKTEVNSYMPILTLTTDLGTQDQYVAAIKGSLISLAPTATLIDISHDIPSFDFYKAAYILKHSYYFFPEKTIHLIGVTPFSTDTHGYLAAQYKNHFFIGPDSGLFSAIFDEPAQQLVKLNGKADPKFRTFSLIDLPVKAAAKLLNGAKLSDIGEKTDSYYERNFLKPFASNNSIDGYITHIDRFKNIITDIDLNLFKEVGKNRAFTIAFKNYTIRDINTHYEDVISGESIAFFNFQGFLEIAINYGNAASLLNFNRGEKIKIIFNDHTDS